MENINNLTINEAEKQIREYLSSLYVDKPREPLLINSKPSKEDIENYTKKVEQYNIDLEDYNIKNEYYKSESKRLCNLLEEEIKKDSGLYDIPEQYRNKVYNYAYSEGHSSGYIGVYNYLVDLVNIFK